MTKYTRKTSLQFEWAQKLFLDAAHAPEELWRNILNPNSLRLTSKAYKELMSRLDIKFYHFKIDRMSNLQLLQLDHLLQSPYYITSRHFLELLGETDAIMLQLHGNNLKQYLDNLDLDH